jgi:hypothetical protein
MSTLYSLAFALVLALGACVDDDIGTLPQPPADGEGEQTDDDRTPIDPPPDPGNTPCTSFDSKGDSPCTPH